MVAYVIYQGEVTDPERYEECLPPQQTGSHGS
jgi:hypothetical protein